MRIDAAPSAYTLTVPEGRYEADSLWALWWEVLRHRAWHWWRGDGWRD
jgi:hypothetical protein